MTIAAFAFLLAAAACGKKGPPLPPLVKLPAAPADLTAARRADTVELQFTVPGANTDDTRPANVARVDVYAFTGPASASEAQVLQQGTKVASIAVKAPRDPNDTFDPGDPDQSEADVEPPEGAGLDQGAVAHVEEQLTPAAVSASTPGTPVRTYVGVGVSTKGRLGPSSRRVSVPLVPPPPAPPRPDVSYTETETSVTWAPVVLEGPGGIAYHVYEIDGFAQTQLTRTPVAETRYMDRRMTWATTRCYGVRTVETVDSLSVESEASPPVCVALTDTFPPAAPKGLQAVATEGVINLIWDANTEPDLEGYILLRGVAPADELTPITSSPTRDTAFQDRVPSGVRYAYAVRAVDKAGNASPLSDRTEETAR